MRKKRIKHQVDTFCEMFSGWRISGDIETLITLKTGKFTLDFIENCVLLNDNIYSKPFHLFNEISNWFDRDLAENDIDKKNINKANLIVHFSVSLKEGKPKSRNKRAFIIELKMRSEIFTDEKEYSIEKENVQEYHSVNNKQFGFE